ncbi:MAG: hypothetical protein ACPGLV_08525 [Bacteroidia bacterium]
MSCQLDFDLTVNGNDVTVTSHISPPGFQTPPTITNSGSLITITYGDDPAGPVNDTQIVPINGATEVEVEVESQGRKKCTNKKHIK